MIKSIHIDGFRHFEDFTINFNYPYTLICGLNGTGKTAVIEILSRLQRFILNKTTVSDLFTETDIPAWEQAQTGFRESSLCLETKIGRAKYSYSLQITTALKNLQSMVSKESLAVNGVPAFESDGIEAAVFGQGKEKQRFPVDNSITALSLARPSSIIVRNFLQQVSERIFSLSINPYTIPAFHPRNAEAQFLEFDASNFSAWYTFLLAHEPAAVAQTFPEISNFIPGFKQFSTPPKDRAKEVVADVVLSKRKYSLPFDALSHGQKVLSILHLLVRMAPKNSTIAIDELENFLSPTELQPLYDAFQDAYEERNIQFILISHNPKTLRWYTDSAIILSFAGNPPKLEASPFNEDISLIEFLSESAMADEL